MTLASLLKPEGKLLISVPVETGMPLLIKQAARRIAGWRGLGDYKYTSAYTLREYCASLFPGKRQHITRPIYKGGDEHAFHDHKGFNWKVSARNAFRAVSPRSHTQLARHVAAAADGEPGVVYSAQKIDGRDRALLTEKI